MEKYYILIKIAKHRPKRWIQCDHSDFQTFLGELSCDYKILDKDISQNIRYFYANNELRGKIIY